MFRYRAEITSILGNNDVSIIFIDYGNEHTCQLSDLRVLPDEFNGLPPFVSWAYPSLFRAMLFFFFLKNYRTIHALHYFSGFQNSSDGQRFES